MTHPELNQTLQDYVLGLLPPARAAEVTDHLADCAVCRQTVQNERAVGEQVRATLALQTRPDGTALRQFMPAIPAPRQGRVARAWRARLAPALIVLFLLAGALLLRAPETRRSMSFFGAPTATATATNTPTATIAQQSTEPRSLSSVGGELSSLSTLPLPAMAIPAPDSSTPAAQPTPAAAAKVSRTN